MAKAFSLGDYLKPTEGVSNSDTGQEQLRYIPLDQIDPDPGNFYSLEGLDELAANIELIGLQQPLRVRPTPSVGSADSSLREGAKEMRWTVVSGHRRRAACLLIRDGGSHMFDRGVPCLVDYGEASSEMRELRLIYANSSTRVMSSAELSRQAERVTELLYQLKEQGVEFPGRMRDHVAEACRVSASKLARLHAIRENLIPQFLEKYDAGAINESVAYRLSQETPGLQWNLDQKLGPAVKGISAETLDACIAQEKKRAGLEDEEKTDCHTSAAALVRNDNEEKTPAEGSAIDGLKKYLDGKSDEDRKFWEYMQNAADTLIKQSFRSGAGPNRKENIDMLRLDCRNSGVAGFAEDWAGCNDGLILRSLSRNPIKRSWTETYDALAAIAITRWRNTILDRRNTKGADCHTSAAALVRNDGDAAPAWMTGTPTREGYYVAKLRLYDKMLVSPRVIWWDGSVWRNSVGDDIRERCIDRAIHVEKWWPLPEKE